MRINCPWCGERDQNEFRCGGQANLARPSNPAQVSDEEWAAYLFYRDNPKGPHHERWVHIWGCRQWFSIVRDTVSHQILQVDPVNATVQAGAGVPLPDGGDSTAGAPFR
jgi:sarcosine oxidase subunit delta